MKNYRVRVAGEVLFVWRDKGEIIALTDEQAQHLAPPFGRTVELVEDAAEQPGTDAPKKAKA